MNIPVKRTPKNTRHKAKVVHLSLGQQNTIRPPDKLVINNHDVLHVFAVADVLFIEAESNYSKIHCVDGKIITASKTLKHFVKTLQAHHHFIRVHNSFLVNAKFIQAIHYAKEISLKSISRRIPLSRRKKSDLINYINQQ